MAKPLTVRLDPPDYERLEREARSRGVRPGTLARALLHASLSTGVAVGRADASVDARLGAIDRLTALAADRPGVDAVRLVADAREEIGARPAG